MQAPRAKIVIAILIRTKISSGWVDKSTTHMSPQLRAAEFDDVIIEAQTDEVLLDENKSLVSVLDKKAQ